MIRSLMYLTASRPDIQFLICLCARDQANPKESYLIAVNGYFRGKVPQISLYDRDLVSKGIVNYISLPLYIQLAIIFAKPLEESAFKRLIVELGGVRGEIGITTFRNAIRAHYLPHSKATTRAGGPTSFGTTSSKKGHTLSSVVDMVEGTKNHSFDPIFVGSNPSVLVDKTKSVGDGLKTAHTDSDVPKDTSVPHPPSLRLAQIQELIVQVHLLQSQKKELEQQKAAAKAEAESLKAKPSYPDINQLTALLVTSLKPELAKLLASYNLASCLPTKLKELPSKVTKLSEEIKELKQHVKDIELELREDEKVM
ncbi:hypothetical protein Tco_0890796 [Tanacetum coccineum]|uniref:Uncharacterized protein n=1 Tax=Tanacetum coccineum TaxID=301880 RepID=A0ABQ5C728_9ASTR